MSIILRYYRPAFHNLRKVMMVIGCVVDVIILVK